MILTSIVAGAITGIANGDYLVDGAVRPRWNLSQQPAMCRGCGYALTSERVDGHGRCNGCGCPTGEPPSRNRGVGSLDLETPFGLPLSPPVVPPGA